MELETGEGGSITGFLFISQNWVRFKFGEVICTCLISLNSSTIQSLLVLKSKHFAFFKFFAAV